MHRFFGGGSKTVNLYAYLKSYNFFKWTPTPIILHQYDDSNVLHNLLKFQKVVNVRNY